MMRRWLRSRLREDYDSYVVARVCAQRFFDGAMRRYEEGVREKSWRMQTALTDGG